jgi:GNAT superfamily N-acetyltransferase
LKINKIVDYKFQLSTDLTLLYLLSEYDSYTFPRISDKMKTMDINDPLLAILVKTDSKIAGMAVAEFDRSKKHSEILSLLVDKEHRNRGLGSKLVNYITVALAKAGYREARIYFRSNWESKGFIFKLVEKDKWTTPVTLMHIFKSSINHRDEVRWTHDRHLPEGMQIVLWIDIDDRLKNDLERHIRNEKIIPRFLAPFVNAEKIETLNSVGLLYKSQIIGWNITYRLDKDTIEYNNLFVREEYRRHASLPVALLNRSVQIQFKNNIPGFIWLVDNSDRRMLNFIYRRIGPFIDSDVLVMQTAKKL